MSKLHQSFPLLYCRVIFSGHTFFFEILGDFLSASLNNFVSLINNISLNCIFVSVDGNWGDWGEWGACDSECVGGVQERTRACDNPAVAGAGTPCPGDSSESQGCNDDIVCPGKCSMKIR